MIVCLASCWGKFFYLIRSVLEQFFNRVSTVNKFVWFVQWIQKLFLMMNTSYFNKSVWKRFNPMTDQPKKTTSSYKDLQLQISKSGKGPFNRFLLLLSNVHTFISLLSGVLMILTGLTLVSITILGFITPLWVSAVLTLLGSISSMVGGFLIYQTVSSRGSFDTLINKAIRRVVDSQN